MTSQLFDSYAQHLARVGDVDMWVGRRDGFWFLAVDDRSVTDGSVSLQCTDPIDTARERAIVKSWLAELLGVRLVELHRDSRAPGAFMVTVEA